MDQEQILKEQVKNAPPEIKNLLVKNSWSTVVSEIAQKNRFSKDQEMTLENEVLFVILSMELSKDLAKNTQDSLGIQENLSQEIAQEINTKIFKEIEMFLPQEAQEEESAEPDLIENIHDENSAENIRNILKANSGEDREKLIENQFKKLPEALQEAIQIVPWRSVVKEIALLNKLDLSQIVAVERETMFVIYGFEDEKNYLANIMKEAKLEESVAVSITKALNDRVFKVIINKVGEVKPSPKNVPPSVPKIQPDIHPVVEPAFAQGSVMVKKGEVVHDVPHVEQPAEIKEIKKEAIPEKPAVVESTPVITSSPEQPKKERAPLPINHYPDGKDPYREPLV